MLPCVPHLINIAQLGGLGRKEQRGIWRAGEAVFAHESEILSEVPAEPERGCARQIAASGRGDAEVAAGCRFPASSRGFANEPQRAQQGLARGTGGIRPASAPACPDGACLARETVNIF